VVSAGHHLHEIHIQRRDQDGDLEITRSRTDQGARDLARRSAHFIGAERRLNALTAVAVELDGEQRRVHRNARHTELERVLREAIDPCITP
jgi:hypothetical protein